MIIIILIAIIWFFLFALSAGTILSNNRLQKDNFETFAFVFVCFFLAPITAGIIIGCYIGQNHE